MARRNPDDKWQQRVAWHELGHGLVFAHLGIKVARVVHTGAGGYTDIGSVHSRQWREYAIGGMAGSVGEWAWEKYHGGWFGSRSHCQGDMRLFAEATAGRNFSESKARSEAKRIILRHRDRIEHLAPQLIIAGRLSGGQL